LISADLDAVNGGVLLRANFQTDPDTPTWPANLTGVRFFREDGTPIRSGSPRPAPGGIAYAYDREAPCGTVVSWYCVPEYSDDTVAARSDLVSLQTAQPSGIKGVWLKSISDPSLQAQATATAVPEITYSSRSSFTAIRGLALPSASVDTHSAATGTWSFYVPDAASRAALQAVLVSGVVLVQTRPDSEVDDMYVVFGDVTRTRAGSVLTPDQLLSADFTEVAAPPTEGSALYVPGHSWTDFQLRSGTWEGAVSVFGTWDSALTG